MMPAGLVGLLAVLGLTGCGGPAAQEPNGTPVTLSAEDLDAKFIHPEKREWYGWQRKGLSLAESGRYDEALYCFNRAVDAWPREMNDDSQRAKHKPEPTDTYLQKAALYLKIDRPELAIVYYDKFEEYFPGNRYAVEGRTKAQEMLAE
jgi:tetratricopeptide (TPR) repeat protein